MDDNKMTPELNFDSFDATAMPSLTLEVEQPREEAKPEPAPAPDPLAEEAAKLSPEEQKMVEDFTAKIDVTNSQMVLQYGAATQKKVGDFSEAALDKVRTKDLGEVGEALASLVGELKNFDAEEEESKGIFGFFKKAGNNIDQMKTKYAKAETNVERIEAMLEAHQVQLLKDIALMDKMYQMNMLYFKELTMYILAGKKKLAQVRANELQQAMDKAKASGLPEDAQAARDLSDMCDRFEKKLYDLQLTRTISIQMGPQIRLLQNNDTMMAEKIQTSIVNTIPLWKSQMVLALGLAHSRQAIDAQRAVSDMTNELLKKNAAALKQGTIDTAKESERGIVDIETLQQTNKSLIETLDELARIQTEGKQKRAAAEQELGRIEGELKQKLMELH
ncbi:toxic anion resistance protein [Fournierella massiliensis]|uniref:toxic anion resistance protein n=1 Tax=Allofournierella massiliensis TaxID=1650663 RepID=UPI0035208A6B